MQPTKPRGSAKRGRRKAPISTSLAAHVDCNVAKDDRNPSDVDNDVNNESNKISTQLSTILTAQITPTDTHPAPAATPAAFACLQWEGRPPYNLTDVLELIRIVRSNLIRFDALHEPEYIQLASDLRQLNRRRNLHFTMFQASSVRSLLAIHICKKAMHNPPDLSDYFKTYSLLGEQNHLDIVRGAARVYRLPPLHTVKMYFKFLDVPPTTLHSNKQSEYSELIHWAQYHDANSSKCQAKVRQEGELFEVRVEQYLRNCGIVFKTQSEITAEQRVSHGTPYATPDILFPTPLVIVVNGTEHEINWLDAKNYMYVPICNDPNKIGKQSYKPSFIDKSLIKQAIRYQKYYGNGAYVFAGGIMSSEHPLGLHSSRLQTDSVSELLLLDGSLL